MGFAVPAAMGAKVGAPDSTVWAIDGDGCFQMTNQELATCAINNIPIKVAIINNGYLGMVRQWQELFYDERYSDIDLLAPRAGLREAGRGQGCVGLRGESPEEVDGPIEKAMSINDAPVVVDFRGAQGRDGVADGRRRHEQLRHQGRARHGAEVGPGGLSDEPPHPVRARGEQAGRARPVAGLFSRRGFNIESLAVGPTETPRCRASRSSSTSTLPLEQVTKQLNKLINVLKIVELDPAHRCSASSCWSRWRRHRRPAATSSRPSSCSGPGRRRGRDAITIEATGSPDKLEALLRVLEPFGIRELVKSGMVALGRGSKSITDRPCARSTGPPDADRAASPTLDRRIDRTTPA